MAYSIPGGIKGSLRIFSKSSKLSNKYLNVQNIFQKTFLKSAMVFTENRIWKNSKMNQFNSGNVGRFQGYIGVLISKANFQNNNYINAYLQLLEEN